MHERYVPPQELSTEGAEADFEAEQLFSDPSIPELLSDISKRIRATNATKDRAEYSLQADQLAQSFGAKVKERPVTKYDTVQKIKGGAERLAYQHTNPRKVTLLHLKQFQIEKILGLWDKWHLVSLSLDSKAERAKFLRQFDLIKVLHALYPDQIADIHSISSRKGASVREKIEGGGISTISEYYKKQKFSYLCRKVGIKIDTNEQNFIKQADGNVVYVDNIYEFEDPKKICDLLREKIEEAPHLSQDEKQRAIKRVGRLISLAAVEDSH